MTSDLNAASAAILESIPITAAMGDGVSRIWSARTAVMNYYQSRGLREVGVDDIFIGNGVSELISMVLQAFVDDGNEILVPTPDYPLWTAAVTLAGGTPVHYLCDEEDDWNPDLADIESKITENTHGLVIINPNNPTGAVYSREVVGGLVDIARRHELVVFADEIYEKILFDDAVHHHAAAAAGHDVLCLTFSGLSKAYRVCGYRAGWVMVSGPKELATDFLEGLTLIANMRRCANVPAQHAIQTALGGYQSVEELIATSSGVVPKNHGLTLDMIATANTLIAPWSTPYTFGTTSPNAPLMRSYTARSSVPSPTASWSAGKRDASRSRPRSQFWMYSGRTRISACV